jgi:hypothetical protein
VSRDQGYKSGDDIIALGKKAMDSRTRGLYLKYYSMLAQFQQGKKNYKIMPALIDTARILGQNDVLKELEIEYYSYLQGLSKNDLYTKKNISFIASTLQSSKDVFFYLFYPHGEKVDSVMGINGYAQLIVDEIILKEDIYPLLRLHEDAHKNDLSQVSSQNHPNWIECIEKITNKYNADFANRTVLRAQVRWYQVHKDYALCARYFTILINNYFMDNYTDNMDLGLNSIAWDVVFKRSVDKEQIDAAIECMQGVIKRQTNRALYAGEYLDTYAHLLYKAGRVSEALKIEEEAIQSSIKANQPEWVIREFQATVDKMKEGKPTWRSYIGKND